MFGFLVALFSFGFCAAPIGTLLQVDIQGTLAAMNTERGGWFGIPILEWNLGLQTMAENTCVLCNAAITTTAQQRSDALGKILGFPSTTARWASVGENRAYTDAGAGNPGATTWLVAYAPHNDTTADYNCVKNTCKSGVNIVECEVYTQVIWYRTEYVGCGLCSCPKNSPTGSNPWTQIVCNFNEAGNFKGETPFQTPANTAAICNRSFTIPFPQPQPVCATCQDTTNCPAPNPSATCVGTGSSSIWVINGDTAISALTNPINCSTTINGSLTGGATDELKITYCGSLFVNGAVSFTAPPEVEVDMLSKGGVATPGTQIPIMTFLSGTPTFQAPFLTNTWTPSVDLSARVQSSVTSVYINFYATSNQGPAPTSLPDGTTVLNTSPGTETLPPPEQNAGGTLVNPDRPLYFGPSSPGSPGAPGAPGSPGSNKTKGGKGLPGWAIFLIVLACIIGVALLIGVIILLVSSSSKEERM